MPGNEDEAAGLLDAYLERAEEGAGGATWLGCRARLSRTPRIPRCKAQNGGFARCSTSEPGSALEPIWRSQAGRATRIGPYRPAARRRSTRTSYARFTGYGDRERRLSTTGQHGTLWGYADHARHTGPTQPGRRSPTPAVSRRTAYRPIKRGDLDAVHVGASLRIRPEALAAYLDREASDDARPPPLTPPPADRLGTPGALARGGTRMIHLAPGGVATDSQIGPPVRDRGGHRNSPATGWGG